MLVLTRKTGDQFFIGDQIKITILRVSPGGAVRIGIDAPKNLDIVRTEVVQDDSEQDVTD